MIAALLLCALGAFAATDARATLSARPAQVEVGQPIEVELAIEHALGAAPTLPKNLLGLDASWVVLEQDGPRLEPLAGDPARGRTVARLRVASLEPGAREIPALRIACGGETATTAPARVEIASLLGDGEAHERPPKGFRTDFGSFARRPRWPWVAGFALALALGAGWWIRRRLKRRAPVAIPRTPQSLLEELERGDLGQPEVAREAHFALTRILRDALDRESGGRRAGLDDDEWLRQALADAGLGPRLGPAREELAGLLRACGEVKYGGAGATQWAARERLAKARELLGRLQTAEAPR